MPTRRLEKEQWQPYFDRISRELPATNVDVQVSGADMGVQTESRKIPLLGLTYDPRDDAFSILCENLEHRVTKPRSIAVEEAGGELEAVEIIDEEDHRHIAKLSGPLQLPPR